MSDESIMEISDELKLQLIKNQFKDLMTIIKMQITIMTTLEAKRQYESGELPEQFHEVMESPAFKEMFDSAVQAQLELTNNLVVLADNVGAVFGINFSSMLPDTAEGRTEMSRELFEEINRRESAGEWEINDDNQ